MICVTLVDTIRTPVVDVIGQLIRDVNGRLSVKPRCNRRGRLNNDCLVLLRTTFTRMIVLYLIKL